MSELDYMCINCNKRYEDKIDRCEECHCFDTVLTELKVEDIMRPLDELETMINLMAGYILASDSWLNDPLKKGKAHPQDVIDFFTEEAVKLNG